jgi:hypothetical protein
VAFIRVCFLGILIFLVHGGENLKSLTPEEYIAQLMPTHKNNAYRGNLFNFNDESVLNYVI